MTEKPNSVCGELYIGNSDHFAFECNKPKGHTDPHGWIPLDETIVEPVAEPAEPSASLKLLGRFGNECQEHWPENNPACEKCQKFWVATPQPVAKKLCSGCPHEEHITHCPEFACGCFDPRHQFPQPVAGEEPHEQTIELLEAYSAELRANMDELQMRESLAKRGWAIEMEKSRAAEARAKEMETAMRQIYGIAKAMAMGQCRAAKSIITADMNAIADLSETFLASTAPEGGAAK